MDTEALVEEVRATSELRERRNDVSRSDAISAVVLGGGFLLVVLVGMFRGLQLESTELGLLVALGVAHVLAGRVVFESTAGAAVATQPILVVALLVLPPLLVPVVVAAGILVEQRPTWSIDWWHQLLVGATGGWHAVGAALVFWAVEPELSLSSWRWYLLALVAQFAADAFVAAIRCASVGLSLGVLVQPLRWTYAIDALLAPVGLTAVLAAGATGWAVLLALPPVGVLALVARDRVESFERVVTIGSAFEGEMTIARTDPLTDLPNRRAWDEAVAAAATAVAADPSIEVVVLMSDVDGLKALNDTLGHEAGDRYLCAAARLLSEAAPDDAHVARLGGDEFGILVVGTGTGSDRLDLDSIVGRIRSALVDAPEVHGRRLSMSIGVATNRDVESHGVPDLDALLALADERSLAEKSARRAGR